MGHLAHHTGVLDACVAAHCVIRNNTSMMTINCHQPSQYGRCDHQPTQYGCHTYCADWWLPTDYWRDYLHTSGQWRICFASFHIILWVMIISLGIHTKVRYKSHNVLFQSLARNNTDKTLPQLWSPRHSRSALSLTVMVFLRSWYLSIQDFMWHLR